MLKLVKNIPLWAYPLAVLGFILAGIVAYSDIFPNPQLTNLEKDFLVHEASPAHGIDKLLEVTHEMHVNQVVMMNDIKHIREDQ